MGEISFTVKDYDNETSVVKFPAPDMTAANAVTIYGVQTAAQTALDAVTLGLIVSSNVLAKSTRIAYGKSDEEGAAREARALVRYYDDTTKEPATLEIPAIDLPGTQCEPGYFYRVGSTTINAAWQDFVDFMETYITLSGHAVKVFEIVHIGQRS